MSLFNKKKSTLNEENFFTADLSPRLFDSDEKQEKLINGIRALITDIYIIAQTKAIRPLLEFPYKEAKNAPYLYFQIYTSTNNAILKLYNLLDEVNNDTFKYQIQIENYINIIKQIVIEEIMEPLAKYEKEEKINSNFIQSFKLAIKEALNKFLNIFINTSKTSHFAFFNTTTIISQTEKILTKEINTFENLRTTITN